MSSVRCPVCGGRPARIYKCNVCNEVRCGQDGCTGSLSGVKGWGSAGSQCRNCRDGRYGAISFFSSEMETILREHAHTRKVRDGK
ncbi:hypothetical protein [Magnetococcus sp. PR-3]|uniref:hypothetical protein n=1 Tax=Magnetococcus sp. PR-3 TaxID=3120355 RepID=UPI002FCDE341